jgi:hypothetical protein
MSFRANECPDITFSRNNLVGSSFWKAKPKHLSTAYSEIIRQAIPELKDLIKSKCTHPSIPVDFITCELRGSNPNILAPDMVEES